MTIPINLRPNYAPYSFLAARSTFVKDSGGFYIIKLGVWQKDIKTGDVALTKVTTAVSGIKDNQDFSKFRVWEESRRDVKEPCPQGTFDMDGVPNFAGGQNNFQVNHSQGLGPVYVTLHVPYAAKKKGTTEGYGNRGIWIHLDGGTRGTAGCFGIKADANLKELKGFIKAIQECILIGVPPQKIFVDWGLPKNPKLTYPPNVDSIIERGLGIAIPSIRLNYKPEYQTF